MIADGEVAQPAAPDAAGWLTARRASRIAWAGAAITILGSFVTVWLLTHPTPGRPPIGFGLGPWTFGGATIASIAAAVAGAVIVSRRPRNRLGWLFVLGALSSLVGPVFLWAADQLVVPTAQPALFVAWLASAGAQSGFGLVAIGILFFPDGPRSAGRWWPVAILALAGMAVRTIEGLLTPGPLYFLPSLANPYAPAGIVGEVASWSHRMGLGLQLIVLSIVLAVIRLVLRFRTARGEERAQLLWFMAAGIAIVPITLAFGWLALTVDPAAGYGDVVNGLFLGSGALPISATLVAITRYHLFDIDRIVSRALIYASLTAILAGIFSAGIALAQLMFVAFTGETSDAAAVITTLVVATLYSPLRKRLEDFVDRHYKFDQPRFGAYGDEVGRLLTLLEPTAAARRLLHEAMMEMRATAGSVVLASSAGHDVVITEGQWVAGEPIAEVSLGEGAARVGTIRLGPKRGGGTYRASDVAALKQLADLVARTLTTVRGAAVMGDGQEIVEAPLSGDPSAAGDSRGPAPLRHRTGIETAPAISADEAERAASIST